MNGHPGNFQNMPASRPQGNQPPGGMQRNGGASSDIRQYIFRILQGQQQQIPLGWQTTILLQQRLALIHQMVTSLLIVKPDMGTQGAVNVATQYELSEFQKAPDRNAYLAAIQHKLGAIQQTRQEQAKFQQQQFQNSQAAQMVSNQQQMMAQRLAAQNHMQPGFGMQQPLQPGQPPPNPMQQQPPQHQQPMARMGSGPDMQQPFRNGQPLQNMTRPMPPNRGPAQFNQQESQEIMNIAFQMLRSMSAEDQNNVKRHINPQHLQSLEAQGIDPIQAFVRSQATKKFVEERERRRGATPGFPPSGNAGMVNPGRPTSQVSMHTQGQQPLPTSAPQHPDPAFTLGNMDQLLGQQQDALRHQEAGQIVVPMSNPQGAPPQVRGIPSTQGQNQFNPSRPMQPPNAFQAQNPSLWNNQQTQQQNPQQPSQVHMQPPTPNFSGVPGQAQQLQGQTGGLNNSRGQRTPQPSHNMPTLNQPLDPEGQVHNDPTQRPAQSTPKANQRSNPNGPQAAITHGQPNPGQLRPQTNRNSDRQAQLQAHLKSMPEEQRKQWLQEMQQRQQLAQQARLKAGADSKSAANPEAGLPSGQQSGPAGIQASQARPSGGNPTSSQPPVNGMTAFHGQSQANQQPVPSNGPRNVPLPIRLNEFQLSQIDPMTFPPSVINRSSDLGNLPDNVKTWRQLKEHVQRNGRDLPHGTLGKIMALQSLHFQALQRANQIKVQKAQPQPQGSTGIAPVGQMMPPQHNQPAQGPAASAQVPFRIPTFPEPTAQEIQNIRAGLPPNMKVLSDDKLRVWFMRQRQQEFFKTPQGQQAIREQQQQQQQRNSLHQLPNMDAQRSQFSQGTTQPNQSQQAQQGQIQAPPLSQPRAQPPKQPRQNAQPTKAAAGPSWTGTQPDAPKTNQKGLKRNSNDDVIEVPDPKLAQQQGRAVNSRVGNPPTMVPGQISKEHFANLTPEQKAQLLQRQGQNQAAQAAQRARAAQANGQSVQWPMAGTSGGPLAGSTSRVRQLQQEIDQSMPKRQEVPMSPKTRKQMVDKLSEKLAVMITQIERSLPAYLNMSKNEPFTKELLRIRHLLLQQVRDHNFNAPVDNFTMTLEELEQSEHKMHEYIALMMKKPGGQSQNRQPQQLNAANLQQQQEALNLQRAASVQKGHANNSNRAPAAPTTSHAPFALGSQSPQGIPLYGENKLTQEKLVLPAAKKRRPNAASPATTPAQTQTTPAVKSSPLPKTESPEAQRTPAAPSMFKCSVPDCESGAAGFGSKEDLEKHTSEAHDPTQNIKDPLDAAAYAIESLRIALNLDEKGKPKPMAQEPKAETVTLQTVAMKTTMSSQGFKQEAGTPMSRNPTQTGPSPSSNLLKTPQTLANVKTPASEVKSVGKDAIAAGTSAPSETKQPATVAPDPWANSHVKPGWFKEIFGGVANLNRQVPMDIVVDWFQRNPLTPSTSTSSGSADKDSPHKSDISANDGLDIKLTATEDQDWVMADWFDASLPEDMADLEIPDIMEWDWETAFGKEEEEEESGGKGKKREPNETSEEWLKAWAPDKLKELKKKGGGGKR